ncbi:hypothetical protein [Nocardia sp. NPDC020380]|uniref:hypothetical protein n=1 Tax=Nocardia sp. NPDC020380 TaxID=3364309 RepID=UPI00378E9006
MLPQEDSRFEELSHHPAYSAIRTAVAAYIIETIPTPTTTHPHLWNVTALPPTPKSEGMRRLLTLHCSTQETLYVTEYEQPGGIAIELTINIDPPIGWPDPRLHRESEGVWTTRPTHYRTRVWSWNLDLAALVSGDIDFDSLTAAPHDFEHLAAHLTTRLFRRGPSPHAPIHNHPLATDLLTEVNQILAEENEPPPAS